MLVAFNKVLHIWRYEKAGNVLKDSLDDAYNNCNSWLFQGQKAHGIERANAGIFGSSFQAQSSEVTGFSKDLLID